MLGRKAARQYHRPPDYAIAHRSIRNAEHRIVTPDRNARMHRAHTYVVDVDDFAVLELLHLLNKRYGRAVHKGPEVAEDLRMEERQKRVPNAAPEAARREEQALLDALALGGVAARGDGVGGSGLWPIVQLEKEIASQ